MVLSRAVFICGGAVFNMCRTRVCVVCAVVAPAGAPPRACQGTCSAVFPVGFPGAHTGEAENGLAPSVPHALGTERPMFKSGSHRPRPPQQVLLVKKKVGEGSGERLGRPVLTPRRASLMRRSTAPHDGPGEAPCCPDLPVRLSPKGMRCASSLASVLAPTRPKLRVLLWEKSAEAVVREASIKRECTGSFQQRHPIRVCGGVLLPGLAAASSGLAGEITRPSPQHLKPARR